MATQIKLPELGENIDGAQVLSILVSLGDRIEKDQPVIELETDKATAEVPSDIAGVVSEVLVKEGDEIKVGQAIISVEADAGGEAEPASAPVSKPAREAKPETAREAEPEPVREAEPQPVSAPVEPDPASKPEPAEAPPLSLVDREEPRLAVDRIAPAAPSVRRLARELGIDINRVAGTGPGNRISEEDVKSTAKQIIQTGGKAASAPATGGAPGGFTIPDLPDFSAFGEVVREPTSRIRRVTAQAMSLSWNVVPHVTQHDKADITDLNVVRKRLAGRVEAEGGKLTVTAIAVKALAAALRVFPKFNSSLDHKTQEIVYKTYVNIGVAVDTDRGLIVPVIKHADEKNITEIAVELNDLAEAARDSKIGIEDLQGGNINLSNLGSLGTTHFSPIVNWPQVAVVGMGRSNHEPVFVDGDFEARLMLPLAVSYDHRIIDGAEAARFLRWLAVALEQPLLIALEG